MDGYFVILVEEESRNKISSELETCGGEIQRSSVNKEISSYAASGT